MPCKWSLVWSSQRKGSRRGCGTERLTLTLPPSGSIICPSGCPKAGRDAAVASRRPRSGRPAGCEPLLLGVRFGLVFGLLRLYPSSSILSRLVYPQSWLAALHVFLIWQTTTVSDQRTAHNGVTRCAAERQEPSALFFGAGTKQRDEFKDIARPAKCAFVLLSVSEPRRQPREVKLGRREVRYSSSKSFSRTVAVCCCPRYK